MRSIVTAAIAAIEAAAVGLAGLVIVAVPALLLWVVTFELAAEPSTVLSAIGGIWLLAHWVPMGFQLDPETALGLGQPPEDLSFALSLAPLGLTLITVLLAARAGWRFGGRGGTGAAGVLGGALGFGAIGLLVVSVVSPSTAWPGWLVTLVIASVYGAVAAVAFVARAARDDHAWWTSVLRAVQRGSAFLGWGDAATLPARAAQTVLLAIALLAAAIGVAALALAVALVVGYPEIIGLTQSLQLDPLGSVLLFLIQLALVPVAVAWALAWLTGAGFSVGAGSSVTPFETLLGPMPALPLFGAIPQGWDALGALAPALLVLTGLGVGILASRRPEARRAPWSAALVIPVVAAAIAGLAIAGLCALASGSLGPGRLAEAGVHPWRTGGLAAAELGIGLVLGVVAGRVDYARIRTAMSRGVPGAEMFERVRGRRDPHPREASGHETAPLDDAVRDARGSTGVDPALGVSGGADRDERGAAPEAPAAEASDRSDASGDGSGGSDGSDVSAAPGEPRGPGEPEEDELLRAFAWDRDDVGGDRDTARARRTGWRWPRRSD